MEAETCFIVDNRVLTSNSFQQEAAKSTISSCILELIGRYLLLCESPHKWLPPASILYAVSSEKVQTLLQSNKNLTISRLASALEPRHTCYDDTNIPRFTWKYLSSGLESFLRELKSSASNQLQQQRKKSAVGGGCCFVICLFTSDKSLLSSVQDRAFQQQSAGGTGMSTGSYELEGFKSLCVQISKCVADMYGPNARVVIHLACAMVSRLSNVSNVHMHRSSSNPLNTSEYEVACLRGELSEVAKHCFGDASDISNIHVHLHAFMPTKLLYDEQLRIILNYHAPNAVKPLNLPPHMDKFCSMNIQVASTTMQGADSLYDWFGGQLDIYGFVSKSKVPAAFIQGPGLTVQASPASTFADKEQPWHQNCVVFAALQVALIRCDALLLIRVRCTEGDSSYWILIPPAVSVSFDSTMTLLRVIDQESILLAGDILMKTVEVPRSAAAAEEREDFMVTHALSTDDKEILDASTFIQEALLSNFGQPDVLTPFTCSSESSLVALSRILQRSAHPRSEQQQQHDGESEAVFVEKGFYARRNIGLCQSNPVAQPAKVSPIQTQARRKRKGAPAPAPASTMSVAAHRRALEEESDSDLSLTPPQNSGSIEEDEDHLSDDDYKNVFVLPKKRGMRAGGGTGAGGKKTLAERTESHTKSNCSSAGTAPKSKSNSNINIKSNVKSKSGKLRRVNGDTLTTTHAFSMQGPPQYLPCSEKIEDTDEEEEIFGK